MTPFWYLRAVHTLIRISIPVPGIFQGVYGQSVGIAGLNYLALGIGFTGVGQIGARLMDPIYKRLKERNGGPGKPEYRLRAFIYHAL